MAERLFNIVAYLPTLGAAAPKDAVSGVDETQTDDQLAATQTLMIRRLRNSGRSSTVTETAGCGLEVGSTKAQQLKYKRQELLPRRGVGRCQRYTTRRLIGSWRASLRWG
eukprot:GHVN01025663.1.p2 GENE.GHVN01025663.1~~GHVN01025663.1.p2  ORF type:complete len:110 (+),score=6.93 GHVN01025663.1:1564-1893(+)